MLFHQLRNTTLFHLHICNLHTCTSKTPPSGGWGAWFLLAQAMEAAQSPDNIC
jgi:hypothetical protein